MTTYAEWTREIAPERNAMHHTVTKTHPPRHRHDSEASADPRTADATATTRRRCKSLSRDQLSETRDAIHHHHHSRDEEEDAEDNYSTVMPQQRSLSSSRVQQQQQQSRHSTSPSDGMILTPSGLAYPINQHGLAYPGNPNTSTFQSRIAVTGRGQPGLHVSGSHPHYRSQQQLHHQHQQQQQQLYSQYHYQPDLYLSTAT